MVLWYNTIDVASGLGTRNFTEVNFFTELSKELVTPLMKRREESC